MSFVTRSMGWEALFIQGLTGALFAGAGSFALYKLAVAQPWVLALVLPLFAFFAWGWWAEAVVIIRATVWMRRNRSSSTTSGRAAEGAPTTRNST